ncbi:MAG: CAP domain-containing protein [Mesorhizobium sp.]
MVSLLRSAAVLALLTLTSGCSISALNPSINTSSVGASASAQEVYGYVRSSAGLSAARPDPALEKAAMQQARYMAETGRMVHTTGRGRDFSTRMRQNGVEGPAAENIAHGRMEVAKVFQMWVDSPPHRRNMLDPRFSRYGLASATDAEGRRYWALVMGK